MGFVGKREMAKAVQPQIARIGDWAMETALSFPFLTRNDVLGLAGMRAVLAVDTGSHSSTYITEGRHSAAQASAMSTHSLLRCTIVNSGTTVLSCGALKPDCKHSPRSRSVMHAVCGYVVAGTGGLHGVPVMAARRTAMALCPCLRAVSI